MKDPLGATHIAAVVMWASVVAGDVWQASKAASVNAPGISYLHSSHVCCVSPWALPNVSKSMVRAVGPASMHAP